MRWGGNLHLEWKTLQSHFQGKRSEIGKQKQKSPTLLETHERQTRVCTFQTNMPQHVNHLTGKNTGLTQLERALSLSTEVLAWCGLCYSPRTLHFSCFLTAEKQEAYLLIRLTRVTHKTISGFYLFWAWETAQGSRTSSWLE